MNSDYWSLINVNMHKSYELYKNVTRQILDYRGLVKGLIIKTKNI